MSGRAHTVIFLCTVALAGIYLYATEQLPSLVIGDPLGPKAFPRLLALGLIVTAAVLLIEMLRARKNAPAQAPKVNGEFKPAHTDSRAYLVVALVSVWTFLYFVAFEPLGYVIATGIYLFVLMAYFNRGKWHANGFTAAFFCVGSYFAFTKLLGVTLARGVLPF